MKNWKKLALAIVMCTTTSSFAAQEVDKVAAVVNNSVVLESDVNALMQSVKMNAKQNRQQLPDEPTLRHQVLERLIMDTLQLDLAKRMEIQIDDKELEQAIAGIAQQNGLSMDQLRQRLAAEKIDYSTYRAQIRKEMTIAEVRNNEVRRRVTILPQEVEALAKQLAAQPAENTELNLSHILLALPENPDPEQINEAAAMASQLIKELNQGADFGKLAIAYSSEPQALSSGGKIGWLKLAELPGPFAEQLQHAAAGAVVGPIRSGVGFHIFRVNDTRGEKKEINVTEVHARHILIKPSVVLSDAQARAKLEEISQQVREGADFASFAKKVSEDPGSAAKGGDLGWATPDIFDPAFADAVMKLSKGEISKPIRSSFGWHLIQLLDTRNVDKTDAAYKDRAYRMLFNRKFGEEVQVWMQEERASAYVKILDKNAQP